MKKIIFLALFSFGMASLTQAQLGGLANKAAAAGFDVKKLTQSIMGKLIPGLSLTDAQQPKVTEAVSGFLGEKSGIVPLQTSNPAEYQKKQTGLFNTLKSKLAGILLKDQMNKFLGMKPATNNPADVLSQLFY